MFGYAIFNINVTNPEDYKEYLQKVVPITEKFGGKYIKISRRYFSYL